MRSLPGCLVARGGSPESVVREIMHGRRIGGVELAIARDLIRKRIARVLCWRFHGVIVEIVCRMVWNRCDRS